MRKLYSTVFFFALVAVGAVFMADTVFSAQPPPTFKQLQEQQDQELGLGKRLNERKKKARVWPKASELPPINMVYVKGGCFQMGDWEGEGDDDERPVHKVCLSDYYIQDSEVSQELFQKVMGIVPSMIYDKEMKRDPKDPVTYVSWYVVKMFIDDLNKITGGFYRLPTEAEWEYAARSRGKDEKWSGTNNEADLDEYAYFEDNSDTKLNHVKSKKPNSLGLYGMSGNVWEWCEDYFDFDYYQTGPKTDPYGPDFSLYRVVRGGSLADPPYKLRTTYRYGLYPSSRYLHVGFRLAE